MGDLYCGACNSHRWCGRPCLMESIMRGIEANAEEEYRAAADGVRRMTGSEMATYRYRDADKWRSYMASYMRAYRARKKEGK